MPAVLKLPLLGPDPLGYPFPVPHPLVPCSPGMATAVFSAAPPRPCWQRALTTAVLNTTRVDLVEIVQPEKHLLAVRPGLRLTGGTASPGDAPAEVVADERPSLEIHARK